MERFDVVVVGAGPAGSTAAYALGKAGLKVLLVERGVGPGSKNMFGGRIYAYPFVKLFGEVPKEAPVERWITREGMVFLSKDSSVTIEFQASQGDRSKGSFTALRPRFDKWLSDRAEAAGATLITGIRVDDVWKEGGQVKGVIAGPDRVAADVVIAADGVVSQLAQRAGLRGDLEPGEMEVGVKETIELPPKALDERFNLEGDQGAAMVYAGQASHGFRGGGFLYTNKTSISLGIVVEASDLAHGGKPVPEIMEEFKLHPLLTRLLAGGKVVEYSTHMIPGLGINTPTRYHTDGFLVAGDAAGFLVNNGYTFRGVDLAMLSGMAAAEAVKRAHEKGDYSAAALQGYPEALEANGLLRELRTFRRVPRYLANERLYRLYPELLVDVAREVYRVEGTGKERMSRTVRRALRSKVSTLTLIRDLLGGARSM